MLDLTRDSTEILERMERAVERVHDRLRRASAALSKANVPYAVVGGHAVAAWVATVDRGAVRNTSDVDILIRRVDYDAAVAALKGVGFVHRRAASLDLFMDGPDCSAREAVHLVFAGEFVKPGEPAANPDVAASTEMANMRVVNLHELATIKLTAFRDKDKTHLRDMIEVGLIDQGWTARLPKVLADRLQSLLDTPGG